MAPLPKYLLWLDFETTGLNPVATVPLEVMWELTDWRLEPVAAGHGVRWATQADRLPPMDDFVRDMHTKSGLIDACIAARDAGVKPVGGVNGAMEQLLRLLLGLDQKVALAGSGVASFDRLIINAQFPGVAEHLTYWALDMGPIRRLAEGTGYDGLALPAIDIVHRAEADVRRAQAEYRQWRAVFDIARDASNGPETQP